MLGYKFDKFEKFIEEVKKCKEGVGGVTQWAKGVKVILYSIFILTRVLG